MTWLHVYAETNEAVVSNNRRVHDAYGYSASIEYYGFDVSLWIPVALSIALSATLVLRGYEIANFAKWQLDLLALAIVGLILLPLWPCYLGTGYIGLGWCLGALSAVLTVLQYGTKFRAS